ncbi:META domain-containing protein [Methylocystis sp. JAN1]|uniref:META domain-containing protein n=1 Tax=Methylocystis sp. JAN1 TaxID=3397211 RepID=UPI003FA1F79F
MRVLFAAVCLLASLIPTASFAAPALTGGYRIVSVAGAEGLDVARTHAEFEANGRFNSTVGCNRIAGTPAFSGSGLTFGPMMATRMACPPPLDQVERIYTEALRKVRGYTLSGKSLVFTGEGGEALVTLERVE